MPADQTPESDMTPQPCRCGQMGTRSFAHYDGRREWRCDECPMPRPVPPHTPGWIPYRRPLNG